MKRMQLTAINGVIRSIEPFDSNCCQQMVSLSTPEGIQQVVISSDTYVADEIRLRQGMNVTAFYDADAPVPLIFPPQYRALIISRRNPPETVAAGFFNRRLISDDNNLQLQIGLSTQVVTANGQPFTCNPGGNMLIVYYTTTTRSIPPMTTPRKIIVLC